MQENHLYACRFVLTMTGPAQLHAYPAAALYGLLCAAHGRDDGASSAMPENVMIDAPEQARCELRAGEPYAFGLRVVSRHGDMASALVTKLAEGVRRVGGSSPPEGVALGGNFEIAFVEDRIAHTSWFADKALIPISQDFVQREMDQVSGHSVVTLQFTSPLRMKRPRNARETGGGWFDARYFDPDLFIRRAARRVGELAVSKQAEIPDVPLAKVIENRLTWLDFSYGTGERRKSLGGAVGTLSMEILHPDVIEPLIWGQYLGAGESTRFGLGVFRIMELGPSTYACTRSRTLLDGALDHPAAHNLAIEADLPPGRLGHIANLAREGLYKPAPVFHTDIPRKDGTVRHLALPSPEDTILQRCVIAAVGPALDLFFEGSSLAYRKGLGRHRAARRIKYAYDKGYHWAVRADFHHFFDAISHELLETKLLAYLADPSLVDLIMRWVRGGAPETGRGLPTGAPISPLLANLFLDQFDERVAAEGAWLVRYADDFLVLFKEENEAAKLVARVRELAAELQLELNEQKTGVISVATPFEFLGFRFFLQDRWMYSENGRPRRIDELGWEEAGKGGWAPPSHISLPGESPRPSPDGESAAIVGPGVTELKAEDEVLCVRYEDARPPVNLPLTQLNMLVVLGSPALTHGVLEQFARHDIPCIFASEHGHPRGMLVTSTFSDDAQLIAAQVRTAAEPARRLAIAKALVSAKLCNYAALADACPGKDDDHETGPALRALALECAGAPTIEVLLGMEGSGAARWYGGLGRRLPRGFQFTRRHAPGAADPVNVLINMAQSYLYRLTVLAVLEAGFSPVIGIFHRPRGSHAALASDLQEPFRHLMDRAVLEVLATATPRDFVKTSEGRYPLRVQPWVAKRLAATIFHNLALPCECDGDPQPYRAHHRRLVRELRRHLLDDAPVPAPFHHPVERHEISG